MSTPILIPIVDQFSNAHPDGPANVAESTPAPPSPNSVTGESSTQTFLSGLGGPQQGLPAQNAVISISSGQPSSALQAYRWE